MASTEPVDPAAGDEIAPEFYEEPWITPPFQPVRAIGSLHLYRGRLRSLRIRAGIVLVGAVDGHPQRIPWPAFAILLAAILISIAGLRLALSLYSPHAKLGFGLLAFLACIVVGAGGGRFVSYAMRVTVNPPFTLNLTVGQRFPSFALADQNDRSAMDQCRQTWTPL